ncbi:curli production assembly/transport component CsgF [Marinilabilia rubra]|uniref:Curli production assembly/transport component CsgF n=1 Tax=Marinilabilia rubra TaxID=2162893 RepID=A0A2U2B405_9BACT|nr:curli production assembly/transport component CsgF [Marinilabilia rubra]PWD97789.1 curli production assembly/transport component CsgF [Marinilabilia rubra]
MKKSIFSSVFFLFFLSLAIDGQDFVYQPVNPAFGGSYLNYSWLLQSANAQNTHEEQSTSSRWNQDPLADFESSLNRQILSQLSRNLMGDYFGEGLSEGQYTIGDYEIEVAPGNEGLEVVIFDTSTGDKTTVTVPYY